MTILLVEDNEEMSNQLKKSLEAAGYEVEQAFKGKDGEYLGQINSYEAAILDLGLPDFEGMEVLKRWRDEDRTRSMPVLICTARDKWKQKVDGLNAGADDYVTKPYEPAEIIARVKALIRRAKNNDQRQSVFNHGDVELDDISGMVRVRGVPVTLTKYEYRILFYFIRNKTKFVTGEEISYEIYNEDWEENNLMKSDTIPVFIRRLRHKLGKNFIQTVRGRGYRLSEPTAEGDAE